MNEVKKVLNKAIKEYNKYRGPRAIAKLLKINKKQFKVQFEGNFDASCCMDEYFSDLVHILEEKGLEVKALDYSKKKGKYITIYKIKDGQV